MGPLGEESRTRQERERHRSEQGSLILKRVRRERKWVAKREYPSVPIMRLIGGGYGVGWPVGLGGAEGEKQQGKKGGTNVING